MRELHPGRGTAGGADTPLTDRDLERLYAYPDRRRWLRVNFVSSLDGSTQGPDARSGSLSSRGDKRVFALLRSISDVILVGAGTARTEGYLPIRANEIRAALRRRLGLSPVPPLAVVSRSLGLPPDLLRGGGAATIVVTMAKAPARRLADLRAVTDVIVAGDDEVDLTIALEELEGRGHRHVLCEGGPTLARDLAAAGQVDEMCLTFAPLLVGGEGMRLTKGDSLRPPSAFDLAHLLVDDDDSLLCRFTRRDGEA